MYSRIVRRFFSVRVVFVLRRALIRPPPSVPPPPPASRAADLREELKRLNGEVLRRFTALVENLVEAPSLYERRVEEITLLFNNMHHLLNAIRPCQARATLEHVLQEQARQKRELVAQLRERTAAASAALGGAPADLARTVEQAVAAVGEASQAMELG